MYTILNSGAVFPNHIFEGEKVGGSANGLPRWKDMLVNHTSSTLLRLGFSPSTLFGPQLWRRQEGDRTIQLAIPAKVNAPIRVRFAYLSYGGRSWLHDVDAAFFKLLVNQRATNQTMFEAWPLRDNEEVSDEEMS